MGAGVSRNRRVDSVRARRGEGRGRGVETMAPPSNGRSATSCRCAKSSRCRRPRGSGWPAGSAARRPTPTRRPRRGTAGTAWWPRSCRRPTRPRSGSTLTSCPCRPRTSAAHTHTHEYEYAQEEASACRVALSIVARACSDACATLAHKARRGLWALRWAWAERVQRCRPAGTPSWRWRRCAASAACWATAARTRAARRRRRSAAA